jgi:hypothetical protein
VTSKFNKQWLWQTGYFFLTCLKATILFLFFFGGGTGDQTQGLAQTR